MFTSAPQYRGWRLESHKSPCRHDKTEKAASRELSLVTGIRGLTVQIGNLARQYKESENLNSLLSIEP